MKKTMLRGFLLLIVLFGLGGLARQVAAQAPERPINTTVVDQTGLLNVGTISTIDAENQAWSQTDQQLQIGVLFINSLAGQDLEELANETFRKWQIGYSGTNNGVLLLISLQDRAFRLETSDQAATVLTDVEAKRILDNSREFFRSSDYDQGVLYIIDAVGDRFYGTDRAQVRLDAHESYEDDTSSEDWDNLISVILMFGFFAFAFIFKKYDGSGDDDDDDDSGGRSIWFSNSGSSWSSSSSSSSFGGGGWSGGGGGGGGASSGW